MRGNAPTVHPCAIKLDGHGRKTIAVRSVVVVDVATRVDIPRIVSVATVSTAQTNILRL